MGINFSFVSMKCTENMTVLPPSLRSNARRRKNTVSKMLFLKVPDNVSSTAIFKQIIKDNSVAIVLDKNKTILNVNGDRYSKMFEADLTALIGKKVSMLSDVSSNTALIHIFTNMVDKILKDHSFNGFVVQLEEDKYIVCGYPITSKEGICGIYIIKHQYEIGFFENDFFY